MKKRLIMVAVAAASLVAVLGGCSSTPSTTPDGETVGEVTLWMYPVIRDEVESKTFWETVESDFEAEHEGIDLSIELQTFEKRDAQISAALAAGRGPDIVMITPDQASTYLAVNGLLPVDEVLDGMDDAFYPASLGAGTLDGQLYGLPLFQNGTTVAYNTAIFSDAGLDLPETWDDVLEAAPLLAEQGIAVMDYSGNPETTLNVTFYPLLWQAGGRIFSEDGTDVVFDSEAGIAALQFLLDLQAVGGLPADAATKSNAIEGSPLAMGKVGMRAVINLPELAQMRAALGEENVQLGLPLTGEEQVTFANPGLLSLTSINSESNREAAYEAMRYLTSPDVQHALNEVSGTFPTRSDVGAPGTGADIETMNAALEFAFPGEASPNARQVMAILIPYLQAALQGSITAEQALTQAADDARDLLARS